MLNKVKEYLRIDTDAEDNYLNSLIKATEDYIKSSFDNPEEIKITPMFENTQLILIGLLYNNRGMSDDRGNETLKTLFEAMILKLKTSVKEEKLSESISNEG